MRKASELLRLLDPLGYIQGIEWVYKDLKVRGTYIGPFDGSGVGGLLSRAALQILYKPSRAWME